MVKKPWPEGGKALVAVNTASERAYHNALNEKLVKETLQLAEQVNHTEAHWSAPTRYANQYRH